MSQMAATEMEWKGRTGPFTILLNPGVFSPTHTSRTIAEALGRDRISEWIKRFGFGRPTGIDYPGESRGIVLPPDRWSGSSPTAGIRSGPARCRRCP